MPAARALVAADHQGEANDRSIDWSDIDAAYELALASTDVTPF